MSDIFGASKETPIGQLNENRSILKELNVQDNSKQHSPLNNKSPAGAVNKTLAATPTTPTITSLLNKTPSNTFTNIQSRETTPTAAGTANSEENFSVNSFQTEADSLIHVDLFGNSMSKRLSTKFIALREFDESDLPDLPDELNPEFCEDPLKLSFNGEIPRSFSADSTATFDVKFKEADSATDGGRSLNVNETDTALSSDNETYAECQSYRDSELNYEYPLETSDVEHYQSAFNTHDNTLNCDQLNATFNENTPNSPIINVEDHLIAKNFQPSSINTSTEPEPMDVDTNSTLELSNSLLNDTTVEADYMLKEQKQSSNRTTPAKWTQQNQQKAITPQEPKQVAENQTEIVTSQQGDSNNVTGLSEIVAEISRNQNTTSFPFALPQIKTVSSPSPLKSDVSTHSTEGDKYLQASPSFPVKPQNDVKRFPTSPSHEKEKQALYLEPSMETSHKTPQQSPTPLDANGAASSPMSHLNSTVEINSNITRDFSPNALNETFNGNENVLPATASPSDELVSSLNGEKRHTLNIETSAVSDKQNKDENAALHTENEQGTFGTCETTEAGYQVQNDANKRLSINGMDRTFNTSANNELRRTFDVVTSALLPPVALAIEPTNSKTISRRTFTLADKISATPMNEESHCQETSAELKPDAPRGEQFSNETKISCTFEISAPENENDTSPVLPLTEQVKQLSESVEAMDIDESFSIGSTPKSTPLPASLEKQVLPLSPFKGSSSLSIVLNTNPTVCSTATMAAATILSKSPPLSSKIPALDVQDANMMPPPRQLCLENKKRSLFIEPLQISAEILSEKEQTKSDSKDEKDVVGEKSTPSPVQEQVASRVSNPFCNDPEDLVTSDQFQSEFSDEDFKQKIVLQPSDFDYLLTKGSSNEPIDRSSLLLRFDPLIGPVLANNVEKQQENLQKLLNKVAGASSSASGSSNTRHGTGNEKIYLKSQTIEEEQGDSNNDLSPQPISANTFCAKAKGSDLIEQLKQQNIQGKVATAKRHANMSVDMIKDINNIDNDCTKNNYELSNSQSDEKQANYKMDELEKKIKNEVLKTEDIEKKLKEAEQREEALIKRITEKDKQILKMSNVTESYEKSIAELIAEKEQLVQNYEKQLAEVCTDRDSNYRHLMSLETTFSDLHVKYEKSKEMTSQLKASEEALLAEKRQNLENLHKQEQRYEKMKYHAMQQLDIANKKLESMKKEYAVETTKLKAQLKKEEISRASLNEQLQQKTRENQELVKICDELISGQGS